MQLRRQVAEAEMADPGTLEALEEKLELRRREMDATSVKLCNEALKANKCDESALVLAQLWSCPLAPCQIPAEMLARPHSAD